MIIETGNEDWPYRVYIDRPQEYMKREAWVRDNGGIFDPPTLNVRYRGYGFPGGNCYEFKDEVFALRFDAVWGKNGI
jgi:hypothetical protein